jgi:hypothetical protein
MPEPKPLPVSPVHDLSRSSIFRREPTQAPLSTPSLPVLERVTNVTADASDQPSDINAKEIKKTKKRRKLFARKKRRHDNPLPALPQSADATPRPYIPYLDAEDKKVAPLPVKASKRKPKAPKWLLYAPALIIFLIGSGILAAEPVGRLIEPKSPFSDKTKIQFSFPLYYPTKPPTGYKIELGSIKAAEDQPVLLMGLSNENGQSFIITQQDQPDGLTLDKLKEVTKETQSIGSVLGEAITGSTDDKQITNVLTGDTWIIITSPKGQLDTTQLNQILGSLKEG